MKSRKHHLSQLIKRWKQAELLDDIKKAPRIIRKAGKHAKKMTQNIANKVENVMNTSLNLRAKKKVPEQKLRQTLITQIDLALDSSSPDIVAEVEQKLRQTLITQIDLALDSSSPDIVAEVAIAIFLKYLYEQWKSGDVDLGEVYRNLRDCESESAVSGGC